ncbi:GNAT family N-acetyltransferase [Aquirufa aurantiipilula]|uniref:GNAT family N-acetyltransferase n=1 Tax=Aquirufa aurantiipilula TaxID=2696561 RepID=A0ABT6BLC1_9BACT|nr:GNAT family N-acetyltransferase [Aquirufa aurantiipilula]MBZ1327064.1 GNAT family N-acetyltransferase [Aquirufa aurantiipilula]MDF5691280.1 GNAT family N-acetyltransferase [Aquirufa aurantiipilula]
MVEIIQAKSLEEIHEVFAIRIEVFVVEQACLPSEEFDELDAQAKHYLVLEDGKPVATGRYRKTEKGIKIERIATLASARGKGYASKMVHHIIQEAKIAHPEITYFYLHSQQTVMPLYASLGFLPYGETFVEADIVHQAMSLVISD